jgi:hypothetical protein
MKQRVAVNHTVHELQQHWGEDTAKQRGKFAQVDELLNNEVRCMRMHYF